MKQIVDWTEATLGALGYITRFEGLCKTVTRQGDEDVERYPAKIGYEETPIDFEGKFGYVRLGQISDDEIEDEACGKRVSRTFPLTLIVGVPNDVLSTPDQYTTLRIAQNVSNSLQVTSLKSLRTALKAETVDVGVSNIRTDSYEIWTTERNDAYAYPTDHILVSMEVTFTIQGHISCFEILGCDDEGTELVQKYVDSDGVEKEAAFGSRIICTLAGECADGTVTVNGDAFGTVASGGTLDVPVKNTGDTDVGSKVGANWEVGDATVLRDGAPYGTVVAEGTIDVTSAVTCNTKGRPSFKTGQTISYDANDGTALDGFGTSFFVLGYNNPFGNTNRFTDEFGTQAYTSGIVLDWDQADDCAETVFGCQKDVILTTNTNWSPAMATCVAFTLGGFNTGWRPGRINELFRLANFENASGRFLGYAPFSDPLGISLWSSTSESPTTTNAWIMTFNSVARAVKATNAARGFPCRTFTYAELGV